MQTVILASGLGTRLRPLTLEIPKSMVLINGKPFLERQLELLKKKGFKKIILCLAYLGDKIESYFGNGDNFGLDIVYSRGDIAWGTGGNIKNAENLLEKEFLFLYGDSFLDIDYQDAISYFHKTGKMGATVVFQNNPKIVPNNIEINKKGEIVNYNKKEEGKSNCVEAGVHVFKKDILNFIPSASWFSLEEDLLPILIKNKELSGYLTDQKFYDIGTFERIEIFKNMIGS